MTRTELRETLSGFNLTRADAKNLLRTDGKTLSNWLQGKRDGIPKSTLTVLDLIDDGKVTMADVEACLVHLRLV